MSLARAADREVWVELRAPEDAVALRALGFGFVEGGTGSWRRLRGPEASLEGTGLRWRPVEADEEPASWTSPEAMVEALDALAEQASGLVTRVDLGSSIEGRAIVGLRISAADAPQAQWRVLGAHH